MFKKYLKFCIFSWRNSSLLVNFLHCLRQYLQWIFLKKGRGKHINFLIPRNARCCFLFKSWSIARNCSSRWKIHFRSDVSCQYVIKWKTRTKQQYSNNIEIRSFSPVVHQQIRFPDIFGRYPDVSDVSVFWSVPN